MDWKNLIEEIKYCGYTQAQIAEECNCSTGNLSELRNGIVKMPAYPLGKALVDMHDRVYGAGDTAIERQAAPK